MDILTVFFEIDEFCKLFEPLWNNHLLAGEVKKRNRGRSLSLSEVMTILTLFHISGYRNLKQFYLEFVCQYLNREFPRLVSYNRFVEFERDALIPLAAYLETKRGICTGISFVDSTKLAVCENLRIPQHKQFADLAKRGFTSTGWFLRFQIARHRERMRRVALVVYYARKCGRPSPGSETCAKTLGQVIR